MEITEVRAITPGEADELRLGPDHTLAWEIVDKLGVYLEFAGAYQLRHETVVYVVYAPQPGARPIAMPPTVHGRVTQAIMDWAARN